MKKGQIGLGIILIGVLVLSVVAVGATAAVNSGLLNVGGPALCDEKPFADDCYCLEGYEKLEYNRTGIYPTTFICENEEKIINLDGDWREELKALAIENLRQLRPECNMIECNQGNAEWILDYGFEESGGNIRRVATAECYDSFQKSTFSKIYFDLDEGLTKWNFCIDYYEKELGDGFLQLNNDEFSFDYDLICKGPDELEVTYQFNMPEDKPDASIWFFHGDYTTTEFGVGRGICVLNNIEPRSVTIKCQATCTGFSNLGGDAFSLRYSEDIPSWWDCDLHTCLNEPTEAQCLADNGDYYYHEQSIVCNGAGKYTCNDGNWVWTSATSTTGTSKCPSDITWCDYEINGKEKRIADGGYFNCGIASGYCNNGNWEGYISDYNYKVSYRAEDVESCQLL